MRTACDTGAALLVAQARFGSMRLARCAGMNPAGVDLTVPDAGLRVLLWLPAGRDARRVARAAAAVGVDVYPLADYARRRMRPGLILGFAAVDERLIRTGVRRLASVL